MVKSRLSTFLEYVDTYPYSRSHVMEGKGDDGAPREAQIYFIKLQGIECLICLGTKRTEYESEYGVIYFPIYLISANDMGIKQIHARIGLFEFNAAEYKRDIKTYNLTQHDPNVLELEHFIKKKPPLTPLLFYYVNSKYLKKVPQHLGTIEEELERENDEQKYSLSDNEDEIFDVNSTENENNWINMAVPTGKFIILPNEGNNEEPPADFIDLMVQLQTHFTREQNMGANAVLNANEILGFFREKSMRKIFKKTITYYYKLLINSAKKETKEIDDLGALEMYEDIQHLLIKNKSFSIEQLFSTPQKFNDLLLLFMPEIIGINVLIFRNRDIYEENATGDDDATRGENLKNPWYQPSDKILKFIQMSKRIANKKKKGVVQVGDEEEGEQNIEQKKVDVNIEHYAFLEMQGAEDDIRFNLVKVSLDNGETFRYVVEFDNLSEPFKSQIQDDYIEFKPSAEKSTGTQFKIAADDVAE